jgi:DNA-binding NarL/FixJ family response regulator
VQKLAAAVIEQGFVSEGGELLSRWVEAFPDAVAVDDVGAECDSLLWVRLPRGQKPEDLLGQVKRKMGCNAKVIALSDTPNDDEGLACLSAGVSGYVNTHAAPEALRQVADVVRQGGLWVGASLMQRLLRASTGLVSTQAVSGEKFRTLTVREIEVARAVARGDSNKEIARHLGITERTVKAHLSVLFEKLGVRDRLQLALAINGQR